MSKILLVKKNEKVSFVCLALTVLYVIALVTSNIIGSKSFVLFMGVSVTAGGLTFPITYILSDVFSEVYGYRWSRVTCYLAFLSNLFLSAFCLLAISTKPAPFYTLQESYSAILGSTPRMLFASLTAYIIGDWANDVVFQKMKNRDGDKRFGLRAILSSVVGEFVDSSIFTPLAFAGTMPVASMVSSIVTYGIAKCIFEMVILPLTSVIVRKVQKYENEL